MSSGSKLWPVLLLLIGLVTGAGALEVYARTREPAAVIVRVLPEALTGVGDSASEDDDAAGVELDTAQPVSEGHARAREQGRRGDLGSALATLQAEIAAMPSEPALQGDLGYYLLQSGRTADARAALERARELGSKSAYVSLNLGVALRRSGELAGAERALNEALASKPGFRAARLALSTVLRKLKRFDEGGAILRELARTGGNAARAEALLMLGKLELTAGRDAAAARAFEHAIEWLPSAAELRISEARAYLAQDSAPHVAKALEIAQTAVALAPDRAEAHSTLARARELSGDRDGAVLAYEAAIRLRPEYHHARRRLLRLALDQENFAQATLHAERLLEQAPDVPEHAFLAGLVAARAGRPAEAREHYVAAIEKAGGNYPEAYFNLGSLEKSEGDLTKAIAAYERAIELDPRYVSALNNLGLARAAAQDFDGAKRAYEAALAQNARYLPAWINLGKLHLRQDDAPHAIEAFERAVALGSRSQQALLNLGVAYRKADRVADAEATYRKLIAAQPRYVSAWYNLGIAIDHAGDRGAEARDAYLRALELDPEHLPSLRRLASSLLAAGELGPAAERYQAILDQEPSDAAARVALAEIHRRRGEAEACVQAVSAALRGTDRDTGALLARCRSSRSEDALEL